MNGPLRVGYFSGTTTHDEDWAFIEPAVLRLMADKPEIELWLGGHLVPTRALDAVADRVRRLPMLPWYELPGRLRDVDINVAPLVPGNAFNESKSAIKWLEAALVCTPTVATPTTPFREAIDDGRTGLLATTVDEWYAALTRLADDGVERARIGSQARREALLSYSPHRQARVYQEILRDAARLVREGRPDRVSTWEPVADDEPYSAAAWVDNYENVVTAAGLRHSAKVGARRLVGRIRRATTR